MRPCEAQLPDTSLGPEWAVLETLCLGPALPDAEAHARQLARTPGFHWGELVEQALRHKVLPLVALCFTGPGAAGLAPMFVKRHLEQALDVNRRTIAVLREETARVIASLDRRGVRCAATKGIVFESTLYDGAGGRFMNDVDYMFLPEDGPRVSEALDAIGYVEGRFDWASGAIAPFGREVVIGYRLNPDHVIPRARLVDDPVVRCAHVDFACSLTWTGSPFDLPVEAALADVSRQPIPGAPGAMLPVMRPEHHLAFTILHCFREAWFEKWMSYGQDVNLVKLADVVRLWHTPGLDKARFAELCREHPIEKPVAWVLVHMDRALGTHVAREAGLEEAVCEEWLSSARGPRGESMRFRGTMRERMRAKDRRGLFEREGAGEVGGA
jgi:hypothetical protein